MKIKLILFMLTFAYGANAQWQNIHTFPNPAYSFITSNNNLYAGLGGGGVYMSQDSGNTWVAVNNGIQFGGAYIFSLASRNDSLFAGGFGEVCFSNDGGANWSLLNLNLSLNSYVFSLIVMDDYIFAGVGHDNSNGVYRRQLNGTSWNQVNTGLPVNAGVNAFAINNNSLFAGTDSGVYVSTNSGANWTASNNGIAAGLSIKSLTIVNGNILAGTNNGVFLSSNNGNTWSGTNGLPNNSVATCFTNDTNYVITGTYESAYFSSDNGLNWNKVSNGLDSIVSFYSLTSLGNYIYAGTGAGISTTNSVFRFAYNTLSIPENDMVTDYNLSVFPNPFTTQTTLQAGERLQNATLKVYNLFGQTVAQVNEITGQTIVFERDHLPIGLYLFRLIQDNEIIATKKIVITN